MDRSKVNASGPWTGRVALVTGGARRTGAAIVKALVAQGCGVVIHCLRSEREAARLATSARRHKGCAWVIAADLAEPCVPEQLVARARALAGRLDFLVNNASVFRKRTLRDGNLNDARRLWESNVWAPLALMQAFARQSRRGAIVNLLDSRSAGARPEAFDYALSKQTLAVATVAAARALAPGIRVNGVAPGPVLAPAQRDRLTPREPAGALPLGHRPSVRDVASAVIYLLGSPAVTGQIVYVDGGQHLLKNGDHASRGGSHGE